MENRSVDAWLRSARDAVAAASDVSASDLELNADDERLLLNAARIAAHDSEDRTNAPLYCYLLGLASGRSGVSLEAIAGSVQARSDRFDG